MERVWLEGGLPMRFIRRAEGDPARNARYLSRDVRPSAYRTDHEHGQHCHSHGPKSCLSVRLTGLTLRFFPPPIPALPLPLLPLPTFNPPDPVPGNPSGLTSPLGAVGTPPEPGPEPDPELDPEPGPGVEVG